MVNKVRESYAFLPVLAGNLGRLLGSVTSPSTWDTFAQRLVQTLYDVFKYSLDIVWTLAQLMVHTLQQCLGRGSGSCWLSVIPRLRQSLEHVTSWLLEKPWSFQPYSAKPLTEIFSSMYDLAASQKFGAYMREVVFPRVTAPISEQDWRGIRAGFTEFLSGLSPASFAGATQESVLGELRSLGNVFDRSGRQSTTLLQRASGLYEKHNWTTLFDSLGSLWNGSFAA